MLVVCFVWPSAGIGQSPQPLPEAQRQTFEKSVAELNAAFGKQPDRKLTDWVDAAIFAKSLTWALRYDREFTPADVSLLEKAIQPPS